MRKNDNEPKKKRFKTTLAPIVFADVNVRRGKGEIRTTKALLDSGASKTVIRRNIVKKLKMYNNPTSISFSMPGGQLVTRQNCKVFFCFSELNKNRVI